MGQSTNRFLDRRAFFRLGAAGVLGAKWVPAALAASGGSEPWFEVNILQLQALMSSGKLTSRELTLGYLQRISTLNPLLHSVIETNPQAVAIAAQLDNERRSGHVRGPLHGIPIIVKDNIATGDNMQTTAGSLALLGSKVPGDAPLVAKLRAAGAVLLGKANLSEWANFRGFAPFVPDVGLNGWSARGGFTLNPYGLGFDPCGSSSGSAASAAANLCGGAVGTETDGSIVCPSGNNLVVGLKPTLKLISQDGIIPIAHSQDTAGPIVRTVTDAAILLGVMQSPPADYLPYLERGALQGARIGIDQRYFTATYGGEQDLVDAVNNVAIPALQNLGATVVPADSGDPFAYGNDEFTVLLFEFKVQVAEYLATLTHTTMHTLADLIAFDVSHCRQEMTYYGQEIFEMSEATSGDLTDPVYTAARQNCVVLSRGGIDGALANDNLDALIAPIYSFASSPAAVAGYPNISVPIGLSSIGRPAGLWMYSTALQERKLLAYAYDLEQELQPRSVAPSYQGTAPVWPDAGICAALPKGNNGQAGLPHLRRNFATGKPLPAH